MSDRDREWPTRPVLCDGCANGEECDVWQAPADCELVREAWDSGYEARGPREEALGFLMRELVRRTAELNEARKEMGRQRAALRVLVERGQRLAENTASAGAATGSAILRILREHLDPEAL